MAKEKHYPDTSGNPEFARMEESILARWEREGTFRKSVEQRESGIGNQGSEGGLASPPLQSRGARQGHREGQQAGAGANKNSEWVFYDGPPFANGLPHYGHLLTSCVKDIFARYHTMKGSRVERRFGWDCHGLPAEMGAEKELGVSGRKAIEEFGIAKFNEYCRTSVMKYTEEWRNYITRAARWVDFENDYKTMDTDYMESVLWAFKQLYDKGLVYESYRVMPYSWAAETPLSNFETRMDDAYRERTDKAVTVAFRLLERPKGAPEAEEYYILAWTTTPWTLPSNMALAVSKDLDYVYKIEDGKCYIQSLNSVGITHSAKTSKDIRIMLGEIAPISFDAPVKEKIEKERIEIFSENGEFYYQFIVPKERAFNLGRNFISGSALIGLPYEPLFPYFAEKKKEWPNTFTILDGSDFIEEGSGTGVVHMAPGFGEDDQRVCAKAGIGVVCPVDESGKYTQEIYDLPDLKLNGLNVIADTRKEESEPYKDTQLAANGLANLRIIRWLKEHAKLIGDPQEYKHSYPHCWRTDTPLIYKAVPSWYVEVTKFKDRMVQLNQEINWIPGHIRDGQFGKWLEGARDWSISRNRFWGTPIPVWRTESGKVKVLGSIAEMEAFFGVKVPDLHKPFIDTLTKEENGETWRRVPDVFDCWFESGSMPFAQVHYPFENRDWFDTHFPADFIVEYVGQTRGWFYTLMVLGTALFDKPPFKNCICHGVILDADGKKLSKKLKNYPDPFEMFDVYGADAMRWRMIKEPVMQGGNLLIRKDGNDIRDVVRLSIKPIWNAYHFFCLYANADGVKAKEFKDSKNVMDIYIILKLVDAVSAIEKALDAFVTPDACKAVDDFFEVLTNWYIRRSKDRFWGNAYSEDKQAAYDTLYSVLEIMMRAAAPLLPLTAEEIYRGLTGRESVHLELYPKLAFKNLGTDVDWLEKSIKHDGGYGLKYKNLVSGMDRVRDACSTALAIRESANIRVRQPLSQLIFYGENIESLSDMPGFMDIFKDEVNVKSVSHSTQINTVATRVLKISFPILGKRLPEKMKQIIPASKKGEWKQLPNGQVEIFGEVLETGEYELALVPKEGITGAQALPSNDALVVLDLAITPELKAEGIARDVVRLIQQARKDANLNITDRISVSMEAPDEVRAAISANRIYIQEQTLAAHLEFQSVETAAHTASGEVDGGAVKLGFRVAT